MMLSNVSQLLTTICFALVFQCSVASAQRIIAFKENGLVGYKNEKSGNVIVIPKYEKAESRVRSYGYVLLNGKYGFIDSTGHEAIPPMYDQVMWFKDGIARVELNGKWGWVDKQNKTVIPFVYDELPTDFWGGLARVSKNEKYGFINTRNKLVIPFEYDDAGLFGNGLAFVSKNDLYGFVDKTGKTIIPFEYNGAEDFHGGEALVYKDGKNLIIDIHGKVLREIPAMEMEYGDIVAPVVEEEPRLEEEPAVLMYVEQMPSFPGGDAAMLEYLKQSIVYPPDAVDNNIQGRVYLQMVVDKDGNVTDVKVVRGVHALLDKEATRVVKAMPKWTPGMQNGKAVSVRYTLPINFTLK